MGVYGNMQSGSNTLPTNGTSLNPPTLTTDRCGNANSAYSFNGTSNYTDIPMLGATGGAARSVAFWLSSSSFTKNFFFRSNIYS
ncbi:hypothetical protein [Aurantibacillus circumpalustris]|uniref:hypothetical protein n=1 Tax=Aurantibacillus circumpalustris TaxID=3036359 RepID=UPI00295BF1EF|nr:hypothetical protein [Aurantibacillus circumpalustris]